MHLDVALLRLRRIFFLRLVIWKKSAFRGHSLNVDTTQCDVRKIHVMNFAKDRCAELSSARTTTSYSSF